MNEMKRQLKNVLEEQHRFTEKNENAVMDRLQKRDKKHFNVYFIAASFITLVVLVIIGNLWQQNTQLQAKFDHYFEQKMEDTTYDILFKEFDYLKQNDALIAFMEYETDREVIYLAYFEYNNGWHWIQTTGAQSKPYSNETLWGSTVQEPFMYAGVSKTAELNKVIVGQVEAHTVELADGLTYWFAISEKAARIVVHKTTGEWVRLSTQEQDQKTITIPIVDSLSPKQYLIDLKVDTMDRGNKEYYEYPLVVDQSMENLQRGDVITYINNDGHQTISRLHGLPGETVEIINGSVRINTVHLAHDYTFAKIMGETVYEQYLEKMKNFQINEQEVKNTFYLNFPETKLTNREFFVVPDNWARGAIEIITFDQFLGNVKGYSQQNFDELWSEKERNLYTQFKMTNDLELFRDVDPITYVRVQLYAQFLIDEQTNYRLYTTKEGHVQWSELTHMKENTIIESEKNRFWAMRYAKLIERGQFQENSEDGVITYTMENGDFGIWMMIKSETGIWQSSFLPIQ